MRPDLFEAVADAQRVLIDIAAGRPLADAQFAAAKAADALGKAWHAKHGPGQRVVLAKADAPGWWLVGLEGRERRLHYPHLGLAAAHEALRGRNPVCADLAPHSRHAGCLVRRAVTRTAADWAENVAGCRELATALRSMRVVGTPERLEYAARDGAMFVLCLRDFPANS